MNRGEFLRSILVGVPGLAALAKLVPVRRRTHWMMISPSPLNAYIDATPEDAVRWRVETGPWKRDSEWEHGHYDGVTIIESPHV